MLERFGENLPAREVKFAPCDLKRVEADGTFAGYASLCVPGADPTTAWHDMTGVMPAFRGRGIAGALKRAAIGWAAANDFARLETENNVGNAPMRAINAALGYAPLPDQIILRGPLADL